MKRRPMPCALTVVVALFAGGCAQTGGKSGVSEVSNRALNGAAAVQLIQTAHSAFAVTSTDLYQDDNGSLSHIGKLPATGDVALALSESASSYAAILDGSQSLRVFRSTNGGNAWAATSGISRGDVPPDGFSDVSVAASASQVLVEARELTSSNFSEGEGFYSSDGGAHWTEKQLPSGGGLTILDGSFWLVGGPVSSDLYRSTDGASWQKVSPPGLPALATLGQPAITTAGIVIPVTIHSSPSEIRFYTTTDSGATWAQASSTTLPDLVEAGVAVPEATVGDNWIIVAPDGSKVYKGAFASNAQTTIISPNGLPAGVTQTAWTSSTDGLAMAVASSCPQGKDSCQSQAAVFSTSDGGQTWQHE